MTQVSPAELWASMFHPETLYALRFSLTTACGAMATAICLGVTAAYFMARRNFPGKGLLETLLDLPLVMPPLVTGVGLLFLFGKDLLGGPLSELGLHIVLTPWGAVMAQAFIATPIVMRSSQAAFASVDRGYEEAAAALGMPPLKVFFQINIPLAGRSLISGIILAWARTMGEFGGTLMVAGATRFRTETLPIAVYLNISSGEIGIAVSCALVLMGAAFILLLATRMINLPIGHDNKGGAQWPLSR
ncbi:MAG: ABC transporter permease subunit [Deltaproteobacteria bacterium]|nr:ABC transporter permease subunit [Deltaproteobacteria bacterium]